MDEGLIFGILGSYLVQLPLFIVWIAGMILAVIRWQHHPRVSLLVLIALALFLIQGLANGFLNIWLPLNLSQRGTSVSIIGYILTARGIIQALISAVAWGLLITAVFGWRKASQPATINDEQ